MSQITPSSQFERSEVGPFNRQRVFNLSQAVNGGIDFGVSTQTSPSQYSGNMNGQWANVTTPGANVEFAVPHNLGRIPSFYFFISDVACDLYQLPNTGTAWTAINIYLKCNVAGANVRVFIT
jgi:hypothetical protein